MKIKETIERECCASQDLRSYRGKQTSDLSAFKPQFCIHCGQIWLHQSARDAGGGTETLLEAVPLQMP